MNKLVVDTNAYCRLAAGDESLLDVLGEADVKDALRRQGTPLPINDVWIAAHAMEVGATLVTFDAHFDAVKGLRLWPRK